MATFANADTQQAPLPSPCVGVCRMNEVTGLCVGCARTADEIAIWRGASPNVLQAIWAAKK